MQAAAVVPAHLAASCTEAAVGQPLPHVHSSSSNDNVGSKVHADTNFRTTADQLKANRLPELLSISQKAGNATPLGPKPTAYLIAETIQSVHATATTTAAASIAAAAAMPVPLQYALDDASQLELDADSPIMSAPPAIQAPYACSPPFPGLKRLCCDDVSELQCCSPSPIKRQKANGGQLSRSEQAESAVMSQQLVTLASARHHAVAPASLLSGINQADTAVTRKPQLRGLPVIRPNDSSSRPPVLATSRAIPATAVEDMSADLHSQLHPSTFSPPTAASTKLTTSAPSTVAPAAPVNFFSSSVVMLKPAQPNAALSQKSTVQQVRLSCIPEQAAAASLVQIEELPSTEAFQDPAECSQGQASGLDIDIDTDDAGKQASNPTNVTLPCDDKNAAQLEHGDRSHTAANKTPSPQVKLVFEADEGPGIKQPLSAIAQQPSSGSSGAKPSAVLHAGSIFSSLLGFDANSEDEDEGEDAAHKPLGQGVVSTATFLPVHNQPSKPSSAAPWSQPQKAAKQACPRCAEPEYGFMPACKLCHTKYHAGCLNDPLPGATFVCQTCQKSKAGRQKKAPAKSRLPMKQTSK